MLQISNVPLNRTYITVRFVGKDGYGRAWSCVGKRVDININKNILIMLPEAAKAFTNVEAHIESTSTLAIATLTVNGTTNFYGDSAAASLMCNRLESQLESP